MKKLILLFVSLVSLTSCEDAPVAEVKISKNIVRPGEAIEIVNNSVKCDLTVVNLGGEGTYNNTIRVGEDFEVEDRQFLFAYDRPGEYKITVRAENSNLIAGTIYAYSEQVVKVLPANEDPGNKLLSAN